MCNEMLGGTTCLKKLRISLLLGFLAELVCAFIGVLGATYSDMLGSVATVIHTPSMFVARVLFPEGGRSTIFRDVGCIFAVQWAIYTLLILAGFLLVQHH